MTILSDRIAVVTGATSGIGFFVAAGLAIRGATIIVTGRDKNRGQAAADELRRRSIQDRVEFMQVDHSIVRANAQLAAAVERRFDRLDLLVNIAGGIYSTRWETEDRYEATLAMNFIGPATVTMQLLPLLKKSRGRCVNVVSSALATFKSDPFADLQSEAATPQSARTRVPNC